MIEHIELTEAYEATPGALADVAAEAVRALNHATFPGKERLSYPSDAYDVIGSLERLAAMLPQALAQLAAFLGRELANARVALDLDRGEITAAVVVEDLDTCMHRAGSLLDAAAGELRRAHNLASYLTVHIVDGLPAPEVVASWAACARCVDDDSERCRCQALCASPRCLGDVGTPACPDGRCDGECQL